MAYIEVPIETEPVDLAEEAFDYLEQKVPGWLPSPGNLEAWLIEALALMAGELRTTMALVPDAIFAHFGESILGLPPHQAAAAAATSTWTAIDTVGYTVPGGTMVLISPPASTEAHAFEVVTSFAFPSGTEVKAGVELRAIEAGAAASGLPPESDVEVLDPLDFIDSVALDAATSGGADAETIDAYLERLSELLTLLAPRPILPQDFAIMAQSIPGVARAVAIDLYDPTTGQTNVPRCVTVVPLDEAGQPAPGPVRAEVDAFLQARREVNFLVHVADPSYETIDVVADVVVYPGYDPAEVAARVEADLTAWLDPSSWGLPPYGDTSGRSWVNQTAVRYLEVAEQVNRTDGVHYIVTLTVNGGTVDVPLTGPAPLTTPGTITCTASKP